MTSRWRDIARPIIAAVIEECEKEKGDMTKMEHALALRRALREAYPFGPRQYHPYKIWLDEIRKQIGKPPPDISELPLFREMGE